LESPNRSPRALIGAFSGATQPIGLVLTGPNFIGRFQHWLHANYDQANLARHHLPAMEVERWAKVIEAAGFEVVYCGYFGQFRFWTEKQARTFPQRLVLTTLRMLQPLLRHLLPADRKAHSPFAGVIARHLGSTPATPHKQPDSS
jgi:hypothetical protein